MEESHSQGFSKNIIFKKASRLKNSIFIHSALIFIALLPLAIGVTGDIYLKAISIAGILYFFLRSMLNIKWGILIFLLLFFLLPDTWAIDLGPSLPLITLRRVFFLMLLFVFIIRYRKFKNKNNFPQFFLLSIGLLVLSYSLSTIFSSDFRISGFRLFHLVIEQILLMFIIFKVLQHHYLAKSGIIALCMAALILGMFGNYEYITKENNFTQAKISSAPVRVDWATYENKDQRLGITGRIHSLCAHPMTFGGFLALMFPMAVAFFIIHKLLSYRILFFAIAFVCFEGAFFSLARSSLIALFFGIIIFLLLSFRIKMKFVITILLGLSILVTSVLLFYKPSQKLIISSITPWKQNPDLAGSSLELRIKQLNNTLAYSAKRPVFGYGPGTGWIDRTQIFELKLVRGLENIWMLNLLEVGWFGVFSLFIFFISTFMLLKKNYRNSRGKAENLIASGGIASFSAFMIFSLATGAMGTFNLLFILIPLLYWATYPSSFSSSEYTTISEKTRG